MTNFLVLGDIHGALPALREIQDLVASLGPDLRPDAVLTTGDFVTFFQLPVSDPDRAAHRRMCAIETELSRYECEVLCVAGNHDRPDLWNVGGCLQRVDALTGTPTRSAGGFRVVGLGGSWRLGVFPYEWEDGSYLTKRLRKLIPVSDGTPEILLSHAPPAGAGVATLLTGEETGSHTIRELIIERQPLLTVCGHVHEAGGWGVIGRTYVLNAGAVIGLTRLIDLSSGYSSVNLVESQANFHLVQLACPRGPILALEGHLLRGRWLLRWLRAEDGRVDLAYSQEA